MKKTMIAMAVAGVVAAPMASADVAVSGQLKYTLGTTENGNDLSPTTDNAVSFNTSEDLGNGLTAFGSLTIDSDAGSSAANGMEKDAKLGIKGDFGTVVMGRMEYLTEGVMSAMMDDGASSHSAGTQLETALTAFGRDMAVAYVSPTYSGIHVALAGSNAADTNSFTNSDILIAYDNGPLSLKASRASVDDATEDYKVSTFGGSYKMGDLKLSALTASKDFDGSSTDLDDSMVRLDYTMGNNSFILGMLDEDSTGGSDDITSVKATHKFSARTAAWIGHRSKDNKSDVTHLGMIHKF